MNVIFIHVKFKIKTMIVKVGPNIHLVLRYSKIISNWIGFEKNHIV